ncbi:hypothetical protein GMLC_41790 [Geomonas limicola]|uniref:Uncharacterized protein n=2 Tax=Geomonas TaxID=2651583 RepID=A0A6V8MQL7_9BACT|nr:MULTISPECIES: hypothetical protein [Geomonas]GFO62013.1 hypothetical protein GMST_43380 [Geomonas silvestris]GFO70600.1 hypothetical protein GMLC_41790 [Geomonas limicola]
MAIITSLPNLTSTRELDLEIESFQRHIEKLKALRARLAQEERQAGKTATEK